MDESAIVSNQKILEIIEKPLAERDVNLYIKKAARALAQILQCDGLLVLRVDEGPNLVEKISIAYSLPGTPTSIVFEPEAFPTTPKDGEVVRIDSRSVKNISDTNSATNYDFYATQFGISKKTQLLIVALKKSESTKLEENNLQTWAICSNILGTHYDMIYVLNTYAEQMSVNTDKDQLTRVHNYKSFTHQLNIAIEESNWSSGKNMMIACVVVSLDDFSNINEKYGFDLGNEVLFEIALKLQSFTRDDDVVGRIGGDMFALILKNIGSRENCEIVSNRIANIFRKGLLPVGEELTASLGVAISPHDSQDSEKLILTAEHLADEAKQIPGTFTLFSKDELKK